MSKGGSSALSGLVESIGQHKKFAGLLKYSINCIGDLITPPNPDAGRNCKELVECGGLGITNDNALTFLSNAGTPSTTSYAPIQMPWQEIFPAHSSPVTDPIYGTGIGSSTPIASRPVISPSFSSPVFGNDATNYDWVCPDFP